MRILIVTDAWHPQVNGVVRTLVSMTTELRRIGRYVVLIAPDSFHSLPCPTYPEIRLALATMRDVGQRITAAQPDAIHIATEGPLGLAARRWCLEQGLPFTTAYHTQFPDYLARRTGLPPRLFWRYIRWFHAPAASVLVSTPTMCKLLESQGLLRTALWGRGVDLTAFSPHGDLHPAIASLPRPIQLYVGRVAPEKNLEAFLANTHPGSKVVVGDGPALSALRQRFPEVHFLGNLNGLSLAAAYRSADVFVFPSRTDTLGLVMIEALASGTPVAAYPVAGPLDIVTDEVGCLDQSLEEAIAGALACDRATCAAHGARFTWEASAQQFLASLAPLTETIAA
jgi:glycosyltransferase involved in cell wall biosynthesis